jgi:hypothetical protein
VGEKAQVGSIVELGWAASDTMRHGSGAAILRGRGRLTGGGNSMKVDEFCWSRGEWLAPCCQGPPTNVLAPSNSTATSDYLD